LTGLAVAWQPNKQSLVLQAMSLHDACNLWRCGAKEMPLLLAELDRAAGPMEVEERKDEPAAALGDPEQAEEGEHEQEEDEPLENGFNDELGEQADEDAVAEFGENDSNEQFLKELGEGLRRTARGRKPPKYHDDYDWFVFVFVFVFVVVVHLFVCLVYVGGDCVTESIGEMFLSITHARRISGFLIFFFFFSSFLLFFFSSSFFFSSFLLEFIFFWNLFCFVLSLLVEKILIPMYRFLTIFPRA
jgi:hypothetical protein